MKTTLLLSLLGLVSLSATVFAGTEDVLNMHVPFAFVAGGRTLPAGDYRFVEVAETGLVMIKGSATATSVALITTPGETAAPDAQRGAKFERHGGTVYLHEVLVSGQGTRLVKIKPAASATTTLGGGQ